VGGCYHQTASKVMEGKSAKVNVQVEGLEREGISIMVGNPHINKGLGTPKLEGKQGDPGEEWKI